jgi:hypothetical protein
MIEYLLINVKELQYFVANAQLNRSVGISFIEAFDNSDRSFAFLGFKYRGSVNNRPNNPPTA